MTTLRRVTVDGIEYTWWIPGDVLDAGDRHLCIATSKNTQQLRVDPYAWELEVRPATIAVAIRLGLASGWRPDSTNPPIFLGIIDGVLRPLPAGVEFVHRMQTAVKQP